MPSPTPDLIQTLIARVGEAEAIRWLDRWSTALSEGRKPPRLPRSKRSRLRSVVAREGAGHG